MVAAIASKRAKNPPRTHNIERSPDGRLSKAPDAAAAIRSARALELKAQAWTYAEIAAELGYSGPGAAYTAVQRELDRTRDEAVDHLRRVQNLQINRSLKLVTAKISGGGSDALWAMDRQIHLLERQAKLNGLDITRDEIMSAMPYQKRIVLDESPLEALSTPQLSPVRSLPAGPATTYVGDTEQD